MERLSRSCRPTVVVTVCFPLQLLIFKLDSLTCQSVRSFDSTKTTTTTARARLRLRMHSYIMIYSDLCTRMVASVRALRSAVLRAQPNTSGQRIMPNGDSALHRLLYKRSPLSQTEAEITRKREKE